MIAVRALAVLFLVGTLVAAANTTARSEAILILAQASTNERAQRSISTCETAILARYPRLTSRRWTLDGITANFPHGSVEVKTSFDSPIRYSLLSDKLVGLTYLYENSQPSGPYRFASLDCEVDSTGVATSISVRQRYYPDVQ